LTDRGNIGVVQTVCRTDRELDLVHAHVQELLPPGVFLVQFPWRFIELDLAVVVVCEDVEMIEEGKITDSLGQKIDFRNTIIIMTTNVGAELIKRQTALGFGAVTGQESYQAMRDKILDESKRVFRPEFLNRLDDMIVFRQLERNDLLKIVDLEAAKVIERVRAKDIKVHLDRSAVELLIDKGYDPTYGARPMRRAVEKYMEDPLADELLRGNIKQGDTLEVHAAGQQLAFKVLGAGTR
jgi:ATP-dependent Clp protease ATP-binding subunit ClpC